MQQVELVVVLVFIMELLEQMVEATEQVVHLHQGVKELVLLVDLE